MANSFKRKFTANIGTSFIPIGGYSVPANNTTTVIGLSIANTSNAGILVDVTLNNTTNDFYVVKSAPIPAGGALVAVGGDQKVVMEAGDSINVKSDTADSADAILSILETTL
jgi:hypothetical protein